MNQFEMIVAIIAIFAIGRTLRSIYGKPSTGMSKREMRFRARQGLMNVTEAQPDPEADRMRDEIKTLKERIQVLERVITDTNSASALDREIEKLR